MELNLTDEWERIVNDPKRRKERRHKEERERMLRIDRYFCKIIAVLVVATALLALEMTGTLSFFIAIPGAMIGVCLACYMFGRLIGFVQGGGRYVRP